MGSVFIDNDKANKSIDDTDAKGKGLAGTFTSVIGTAAKVGAAIAVAGAASAAALGGLAVKAAISFEKEMANVATLLDGDVNKRISELGGNVKKLASDTGTSTALLTDGLYQVVSALGDSAASMGILETAAKGAAAGKATVTDSVNLLAAVTKGYGDTSEKAALKASDLAFLTVKLGQTTFPELASSMGKVIPLASTMKVSQEELFGAMATLTGVTGSTSEVTTQLRGAIQGFMQPSKNMEAALKSLGYENGQVALETEGLSGMLNSLKASVGGNEIAFANLFGSVEAKNAVLALTGDLAESFAEKTLAMGDAAGATEGAFARQQATVSAMMQKIKENLNVVFIEIGEKLLPVFQRLLDFVMDRMPEIKQVMEVTFNYIGSASAFLADSLDTAISQITGITDKLLQALGWVKENFDIIGPAIAAIALMVIVPAFIAWAAAAGAAAIATITALAPVLLPILAVGAAVAGLALLWREHGSEITEFVGQMVEKVKAWFSAWRSDTDGTVSAVTEIFQTLAEILTIIWDRILEFLSGVWNAISFIAELVFNGLSLFWEKWGGTVLAILGRVWDQIKLVFTTAINLVKDIFGLVLALMRGDWEGVWNRIKSIGETIWLLIAGTAKNIFGTMQDVVLGIWRNISNGVISAINVIIRAINWFIDQTNRAIDMLNNVPGVNIGFVPNLKELELPALAAGGEILMRGSVLVGEEGPEILDLPAGAAVRPLSNSGGGVTFERGAFEGAFIMDDYGVDRLMDRIFARMHAVGSVL